MNKTDKTKDVYGFLWGKTDKDIIPQRWHFNAMQDVIDEPVVRGRIGIEIGSGCGYDTYIMAKNNPSVKLVGMDISEGIYKAKELVTSLGNVMLIQCSALAISIKDASFDFAYSFGVLHHTINPKKCLLEINRVLKKDSPAFLYLYEDHSENLVKYCAIKIVSSVRFITTRIPSKVIYCLAWIGSPFIFIIFTLPSKILRKFRPTKHIAEQVPFNFGTGLFSLQGDLYDRFGAPIEHRFSRQGLYSIFSECGFSRIRITRLKDTAGWVVWGHKT